MGKLGKEIFLAALIFASIGAATAGWRGLMVGALTGALVGWSSSRDEARMIAESKTFLQNSADGARADELRLVLNYLHASGIPAWREAAQELSDLKHREADGDPR